MKVGDFITIKAPSRSGYVNSVNVPVYGFVEFRGLERSALAGMMSVLDIHSWRDLYGYLTPERAAEIRKLKERAGATTVAREDAEAALFGEGDAGTGAGGRARGHRRDGGCSPARAARQSREDLFQRRYTQAETDAGVALNAAVILDDPRRIDETMPKLVAAAAGGRDEGEGGHLARGVGHRGPVDGAAPHGALPGRPHHLRGGARHHQQRHGHGHAPAGEGDRHHAGHRGAAPLRAGAGGGRGGDHRASSSAGWARRWASSSSTPSAGPAASPPPTTPCTSSSPGRPSSRGSGTASLVTSVVIVFLVSILSALYPAVLAMRVTPLEAMQSDD